MSHTQGLGYVSGIRTFHGGAFLQNLHGRLSLGGGTDNAYMATLADAGWLALAFYLITIAKTAALGWRFANKDTLEGFVQGSASRHALQCALFLLLFFVVEALDASEFVVPLRQPFYIQNIVIAIILGACASMRFAARSRFAISAT